MKSITIVYDEGSGNFVTFKKKMDNINQIYITDVVDCGTTFCLSGETFKEVWGIEEKDDDFTPLKEALGDDNG